MASNHLVKGLKRSALTVALGMCFVGAALAAETGGLRVTITGTDGAPVAGATVQVSSPDSLVTRSGVTAADGSVRLQGLDPATNYTVVVDAAGYDDFSASNVAVVSGKNLSVGYALGVASLDTVVVTGANLAAIDTTSATVSSTLTLDMVESLPTARSYTSYLQLVPGVKPTTGSNPSSKSGVNYQDIGGAVGASSDNVYLLDGVDVTNPNSGYAGSGFNSEIIQEQQVLTGGVPAEYAGGSGLISKVITKSGGDEFHGSINYYLQNDSLVADNKHEESQSFSTYDTAVTLGGPIIKEKLWFFGSYQKKSRTEDVPYPQNDPQFGEVQRTVHSETDYAFFKTTWQINDDHRVTGLYFNDPTDSDGSTTPEVTNQRNFSRKDSGDNYKLDYQGYFGDLMVGAYYFKHEGEVARRPVDPSSSNTVRYNVETGETRPTTAETSRGGLGNEYDWADNRDEYGLNFEYFLDTAWGTHTIKAGFVRTENEMFDDFRPANGVSYQSIGLEDAGSTFASYSEDDTWTGRDFNLSSDGGPIIGGINASADRAAIYALLDTDSNGEISQAELGALTFSDTAGNPHGQVNARRVRTDAAPYTVNTKGTSIYLQDTWTKDNLTVSAGVRTEKWEHFDSNGNNFFTFDWEFAPRLSVVYDLSGDGTSKVWGFYGRYYDPIRTNMSDFAGNVSGAVIHEDVNINGTWVQYRQRGGPGTYDAYFAPNTKTPYTDEFLVGYSANLGKNVNFSATVTKRDTKNILEDYDLCLYSYYARADYCDENGYTPGQGVATEDSPLYLPLEYFGLDPNNIPDSNFYLGTLAGGKREYLGLELTVQKVKADNWMGMASYTHNSAHGNTNSDSNADFQGDWLAIDPRAPNMWGKQAGNVKHQFKALGAYYWDNGFEVSGVFNWNSGAIMSATQLVASRHLPIMSDGYVWEGVFDSWVEPGTVGGIKAPAYYTLDARVKYQRALGFGKLELFLDIFNILDKQSTTQIEDLVGGTASTEFMDSIDWVAPRRFYLGARYSF